MPKSGVPSTVLTIRLPRDIHRRLVQEARRWRKTRSAAARAILEAGLSQGRSTDPAAEARRQSRLARAQAAEAEAISFITETADLRGWK